MAMRIPWSAAILFTALIACTAAPYAEAKAAPKKSWTRVAGVTAKETVQVRFTNKRGKATYFVASPDSPLETRITGRKTLRLYLSPEFKDSAAPPTEAQVKVSVSGMPDRLIVMQSRPSATRRYRSGQPPGVPGEVTTAYIEIPAGEHAVRVSATSRVAIQLSVDQ